MKKKFQICSATCAGIILALGMNIISYGAAGWQWNGTEWHYYEKDGSMATECWRRSGDHLFYLGSDGKLVRSRLIETDGDYYYVNSAGARVSNEWRKLPNEEADSSDETDNVWYYFQSTGKAYKAPSSGKTSFKSIKISTGETKKYAFDERGHMLFGWVNENSQRVVGDDAWRDGIYYCGTENDGAMSQSEWKRLEALDDNNQDNTFDDEYWFYFQSNGKKTANTKRNINGRKYLFREDGNAQYQWYASPSNASSNTSQTVNSYYKAPSQCWLAVGWFLTVPSEEMDAQAYADEEKYWFYGLNNGNVVTNQIKSINGHSYGFNEGGMMLHGLYKMEVQNKKILSYEKIENLDQLPSADENKTVYYFGYHPKEGVMATGRTTFYLDDEKHTFYFKTSGTDRGSGIHGIYKDSIYENGHMLTIDSNMRYGVIQYDGKEYLVNQSGKIQKNKKNVKDADEVYYSSDKDGIVTSRGNKQ